MVSEEERIYDENGSLLKKTIRYAAGVPTGNYTEYEVDESGQITEGTAFSEDGTETGRYFSFEYDEAGRLSGVLYEGKDGEKYTGEYQYDEHGNRISRKFVSENGSSFQDEEIKNEYDAEGTLIKSTISFKLQEGEIETSSTRVSEYQYDADGKLVKVLLSDENGGSVGCYEFVY